MTSIDTDQTSPIDPSKQASSSEPINPGSASIAEQISAAMAGDRRKRQAAQKLRNPHQLRELQPSEAQQTVRVQLTTWLRDEQLARPGTDPNVQLHSCVVALPASQADAAQPDAAALQELLDSYKEAVVLSPSQDLVEAKNARPTQFGKLVPNTTGWWITSEVLPGPALTRAEVHLIWKRSVQIEGKPLTRMLEKMLGLTLDPEASLAVLSGHSPVAVRQMVWRDDQDQRSGFMMLALRPPGAEDARLGTGDDFAAGAAPAERQEFSADDELEPFLLCVSNTGRQDISAAVISRQQLFEAVRRIELLNSDPGSDPLLITGIDHLSSGSYWSKLRELADGTWQGRTGKSGVLEPAKEEQAQITP